MSDLKWVNRGSTEPADKLEWLNSREQDGSVPLEWTDSTGSSTQEDVSSEADASEDWSDGEMRPGLATTIEEVEHQLDLFLNTREVTDAFPLLWDKYLCESCGSYMQLPLELVCRYISGMWGYHSAKWLDHKRGYYGLPYRVDKFTAADRLRAVQITLLDTQIGRDVFCHLFNREHYRRPGCAAKCTVNGNPQNTNNLVFEEAWKRVFGEPLTTEAYLHLAKGSMVEAA